MVVEFWLHLCLTSALHGRDSLFPHSVPLYQCGCSTYSISPNNTARQTHDLLFFRYRGLMECVHKLNQYLRGQHSLPEKQPSYLRKIFKK